MYMKWKLLFDINNFGCMANSFVHVPIIQNKLYGTEIVDKNMVTHSGAFNKIEIE